MKPPMFALASVVAAGVIAGCGSSGGASGDAKAAAGKAGSASPTVALAPSRFGQILVDGHGRTLYDFKADKTTASTCYGACASLWPPLTVSGVPKAGAGLRTSLLGTTKRTDDTTGVTYNGHPLYRYAPDTKPGEITGQGLTQFGAPWYVLKANGAEVTHG